MHRLLGLPTNSIALAMGGLVLALAAFGAGVPALPSDDPGASVDPLARELERRFAEDVRPILSQYCFKCHGQARHKGHVRFDRIGTMADFQAMGDTLDSAHELLTMREMPPKEETERPSDHEALIVTQWLEAVGEYYPSDGRIDPGWFTIHRLNRAEYENTMRDLLFMDAAAAELTAGLPADDTGYGFDNIADVLTISPLHIDRYLAAAEKAVASAFGPEVEINQEPAAIAGLHASHNANPLGHGGAMLYSNGSLKGRVEAPIAAEYAFTAIAWGTPGGDEDPRLSFRVDGKEIDAFFVTARRGEEQECRVRVKLGPGMHTVEAAFTNDYYEPNVADRNLAIEAILAAGPLSIDDSARTEAYRRIFGSSHAMAEPGAALRIIRRFAGRAYRRPASDAEVEALHRFYQSALANGESQEGALRTVITAILISPNFLYRSVANPLPDDPEFVYPLDDFELASRLSYFLWSSMPDEELFDLAQKGALNDDAVLKAQVRRMLADPKSDAFIQNFSGEWLHLRNLDRIEFDREQFPQYDDELRSDMIEEAQLFFADVVRSDRSILDLIDSRDSFVDQRLAALYGLSGVKGDGFRHVTFDERSARGGILTMAGVLAVTSHPTRTSPVRRGLFVLDEMLGMAPPPPPPDVPPLEQAEHVLGPEASLREQLKAHLADATCASCHVRMDPIGLAMENFDAIGAWRDEIDGRPIDVSGELPGGVHLNGVRELKKILLSRADDFVENLAGKLLTYALGRGPEPFDRPAIRHIAAQTRASDDRFTAMIDAIVLSDAFRTCRGRSNEHE